MNVQDYNLTDLACARADKWIIYYLDPETEGHEFVMPEFTPESDMRMALDSNARAIFVFSRFSENLADDAYDTLLDNLRRTREKDRAILAELRAKYGPDLTAIS